MFIPLKRRCFLLSSKHCHSFLLSRYKASVPTPKMGKMTSIPTPKRGLIHLWIIPFLLASDGFGTVYCGGLSYLPTEIINANKSLIANVAKKTWGDICSFPEHSLGKIFSLLRKGHGRKCPLSSLDVVISGCGTWNGCSHVTTNPDGGYMKGCREHCGVSNLPTLQAALPLDFLLEEIIHFLIS